METNNEYEIIYLAQEANEAAQEFLVEKYNYIIKIIINKCLLNHNLIINEYSELYAEGMYALLQAILNYNFNQRVKFSTFAYLVIDRRIKKYIAKLQSKSNYLINSSCSLDKLMFDNNKVSVMDAIKDLKNDPYTKMVNLEKVQISSSIIKKTLSKLEYEVYLLMLKGYDYNKIANILSKNTKQIDNTIQRIKAKLKALKALELN